MSAWSRSRPLSCTVLLFAAGFLAACSTRSEGPRRVFDAGPSARDGGASVEDAGSDAGDRCALRCGPGATCCTADEECVRDRCLPRCEGSRCGEESATCCEGGTLCVDDACVAPGEACIDDGDCASEETCEPLVGQCLPIPEASACRFTPPSGVFEPVVEWEWTEGQAESIALVVQLGDDDGDGVVGAGDVPDVVVPTWEEDGAPARLTAFDGRDGSVHWQTPTDFDLCRGAQPAAGDLDGDGTVELVVLASPRHTGGFRRGCGEQVRALAFSHEGVLEWESRGYLDRFRTGSAVAIANLDAEGPAEIVASGAVLDATGLVTTRFLTSPSGSYRSPGIGNTVPSLADVDGDGDLEILFPDVAYHHTGEALWGPLERPEGQTAVGWLVDTGEGPVPQIAAVFEDEFAVLDAATGEAVLGPVAFHEGRHGGPPTIADFDGDGRAEVGVATQDAYQVLDPELPAPHVAWSVPIMDVTTGSVASTVFDFEDDGTAEVLFADECHLRIVNGRGEPLWSTSNTSGTIFEYPVIADVDADGNAEIVVVSNLRNAETNRCDDRPLPHTGPTRGIRVFSDRLDNWVASRRTWNQHAYHIDNVRDDGSIPTDPPRSWETHNTFRLNAVNDGTATLAPDLRIGALDGLTESCPVRATLRARVENRGSRGVAPGLPVAFYAGEPGGAGRLLGVALTEAPLLAGSSAWAEVAVTDLPEMDRMVRFHAVADDDGTGVGRHSECDETNNVSEASTLDCGGPI